jgi:hypothetical protein
LERGWKIVFSWKFLLYLNDKKCIQLDGKNPVLMKGCFSCKAFGGLDGLMELPTFLSRSRKILGNERIFLEKTRIKIDD